MTHELEARELLDKYGGKVHEEYGANYVNHERAIMVIKEVLRQRDEARAALVYKGDYDTDDEHTEAIKAAHPIKSGDWKQWSQALEMVSNRKSKGSLVMLVNWLLKGHDEATAQRDKAVEALKAMHARYALYCGDNMQFAGHHDVAVMDQAAAVVREIDGK